ncbi:glycoside hydrolase family 3 protein [Nonomuraea sp. NN258]|uniref:glycoside hydrolase family 3 protein n=1 Tax=Nonomuraea antri TaxID=2730852 RepID=UPI0015683A22|nr:glycoside hydrolase family 3 N-terminal domain-containing protein [Nonomuraea antri]NRQ37069.1 glycoside hydrolase family 3 protein [Nonomuraea antri]
MDHLERLAHAVLFPALGRSVVPRWIERPVAAGLGGFVLFGKDIVDQEQLRGLTAGLRALNPALHLAIDEEGGDVTRLEATGAISTPGNLALGHIDDLEATRACAHQIGLALRSAGVTWDLAPAVDTAVNPFSPNGVRCFSGDRAHVARHAAAWIEGLQAAGVSACAKHFPGHGRSGTDAHLGTPDLDLTRDELVEHYLDPFRAAIAAGVDSIMVSHPRVSALDELPASISAPVITGLLRDELGFDGVVITDALEMRGVADVAPLARAAVLALRAGADALCLGAWAFGEDVGTAARAIVEAVRSGDLPVERLEQAADRLRRMGARSGHAAPADGPSGGSSRGSSGGSHGGPDGGSDSGLGPRLARRAVRVTGDPVLHGDAALVVRLEPVASPASGGGPGNVETLLTASGRAVERVSVAADTYNGPGIVHAAISEFRAEYGAAGDVVILVRSPHRFDWQAPILDRILATTPDVVVLDMGFPHRDFSGARAWVRTFGASRVCAEAAVEVLSGAHR